MMQSFTFEALPARVVFGRGTITRLAEVIAGVNGTRALLLSTAAQADQAKQAASVAGDLIVGQFADAAMHTPVDVTERALALLSETGADCVVSFGGGSTIGLGKALALRTDVPQVAIATTYAGSEMTPVLGETQEGRKTTQRTLKVLPEAVIYDVDFTLDLPVGMSATSGLNAIAHAVEGLYARDTNPVIALYAEEAVRTFAHALPRIVEAPNDVEARAGALKAAWLCGMVLATTQMALHHKLCHTLGGTLNLPHAETHSVILPHALAYNAPAVPDAIAALRRALGTNDPVKGLVDLVSRIGAPTALRDIGMLQSGIDVAADEAMRNPYWNPRAIERDGIRALIARAYAGEPPQSSD
jgi:alcohol dehydrogenase class IV